jgi:ABC-2 type transport system permease protein
MVRTLRGYGRFLCTLTALNLRAAAEYRVSFVTSILFMAVNDGMWIVFWGLFFHRFPVVRGWDLDAIATMWAVLATGFGLATGIFGNSRPEGARVIVEGRLDYYLALPKHALLHYLLGTVSVTAWGDVLFGVAAYLAIVQPGPAGAGLFALLSLNTCVIFVGFGLLVNSLAFFFGNSEGVGQQVINALITFGTYPLDLFGTLVKVVLFSALPAAFMSYLPVRLLRDFNWPQLLAVEGFTVAVACLAVGVFGRGLRRYESGSLVLLRA